MLKDYSWDSESKEMKQTINVSGTEACLKEQICIFVGCLLFS